MIEQLYIRIKEYGYSEHFKGVINNILESNNSAYRLINGYISPVTDQQAISEIEGTVSLLDKNSYTYKHLRKAQKLFSDRNNSDYRNSGNESLHAIAAFLEEKLKNNNFSENKKRLDKISQTIKCFGML